MQWLCIVRPNLFKNLIQDSDFIIIKERVKAGFQKGINDMEALMSHYGLPFPPRSPVYSKFKTKLEQITDKDIFINIYETIQSIFPIVSSSVMNSTSPVIRKAFKEHLYLTIDLHEMLV